jgi:hypothetical protein
MKNYYDILHVSPTASQQEIRDAHRQLVKQWHPDVCKASNAHEKFIEIQEAYEILSNDVLRNEYGHRLKASQGNESPRPKEYTEGFRSAQETARARAEEYYHSPLDSVLDSIYRAARVVVAGESGVRKALGFGGRIILGIKGWYTVIVLVTMIFTGLALPFMGVFSRAAVRSLWSGGRFVGIGTLIESMLLILALSIGIISLMTLFQ